MTAAHGGYAALVLGSVLILTAASLAAQGGGGRAAGDLQAGRFRWRATQPLIAPADRPGDPWTALKDPSVIFYGGRWHLFCSVRAPGAPLRVVYLTFADWTEAGQADQRVLDLGASSFGAPQVFYFEPHRKWYLVCQASDESWTPRYQPAYATSEDIADPDAWSALKPLGAHQAGGKTGLDFWIICDEANAHLFFTTLDGHMWREDTPLEDFPGGWSEADLAIEGDVFEASHTYALKDLGKYLTLIEAQGGRGWRYYKAYLADRLEGPWTPTAATRDMCFAGMGNVEHLPPRWTDCISHGELIRAGHDQRLEADPANLSFVFQGVSDADRAGKKYGEIPWCLGMLEALPAPPEEGGGE